MPDPARTTISGTQCAALFSLSPYSTPWSVYQYLANGVRGKESADFRMKLGLKLQAPILELVADDLRLEVVNNAEDVYVRHPSLPVGCTWDGMCINPSRGKCVVQVKNVADDQTHLWRDDRAPPYVELQIQHEMLAYEADYGIIAALLGGGKLALMERDPSPMWRGRIIEKCKDMMGRVERGDPPSAFGHEAEAAIIAELYPDRPRKVIKDTQDPNHLAWMEAYLAAGERTKDAKDMQINAKIKLMVALEDAEILMGTTHMFGQRRAKNGVVSVFCQELKGNR